MRRGEEGRGKGSERMNRREGIREEEDGTQGKEDLRRQKQGGRKNERRGERKGRFWGEGRKLNSVS